MDPKSLSFVFAVVLLLAVTGTSSLGVQPQYAGDVKIAGGNQSAVNQFPYMVSLRYASGGAHFCGGTLVTNRHVLTSASCIVQSKTMTLKPQDFYVQTNSISLSSGGTISYVSVIHVNEGFSLDTIVDDVAILKLTTQLNMTSSTNTIAMRTSNITANTNCTVSGWGYTTVNGPAVDILRYVNVPIYDYNTCRTVYGMNNGAYIVRDKMICAGFSNSGNGSCPGDGGGPLVCGNSVAGISSFGPECGSPIYPRVYTEVYKYNKWITDAINASLPTSTLSLYLLVIANFTYFLLH